MLQRRSRILAMLLLMALSMSAAGLAEMSPQNGAAVVAEEAFVQAEDAFGDAPEPSVEEADGLLAGDPAEDRVALLPSDADAPLPDGAGEADENDDYAWKVENYEHCVYTAKQGFYWRAGPSASEPTRGYVNAGETVTSDAVIRNSTANEMWLKKDGEEKYVFAGYRWSGSDWQPDPAQPQLLEYVRSDLTVTWSDDHFPSGLLLPQCTTFSLQGTLTANAAIYSVNSGLYDKSTKVYATSGWAPLTSLKKSYTLEGSSVAHGVCFGDMKPGDYRLDILVDFFVNRMQKRERVSIPRDFTITTNPDTVAPTIGKVTVVDLNSKYYALSVEVSDNVRVTEARFAVWTRKNGKDDLRWHDGMIVNGAEACCTITTATHNGETGCVYNTEIYVYDAAGNYSTKTVRIDVPKAVVHPTSVKLNKEKATLQVGRKLALKATVKPSNADTYYSWVSSDEKVATVSSKGVVKAVGPGKAIITVFVADGKLANCRVTVPTPPEKVTLNKTEATLKPGKNLKLKARLSPSGAKTTYTWTSSDESVATVSGKGMVRAEGYGKATITVRTANGKKATCKVKVMSDIKVKYRALLIGEEAFDPVCRRNRGDVDLMAKMLGSVKGPEGGKYAVTKRIDLTASEIFRAIQSTFGQADDNDVSLFFISTHGNESSTDQYAGALSTPWGECVLIGDLAEALLNVHGKVVVILESCGSGAAIHRNGQPRLEDLERQAAAFDNAVVEAFRSIDPGVVVDAEGRGLSEDEIRSNPGELRVQNKFYVLTSSRFLETSWGSEKLRYNYFVKWLTDGIGSSGRMPADTDRDGTTTLKELYKYISKVGDHFKILYEHSVFYQHVQVYPSNSSYGLFRR